MTIAIISPTSLPIKTGPSYTAIERARYFTTLGHNVTLYYPFIQDLSYQRVFWGKQFSKKTLLQYLYRAYDLQLNPMINIDLFNAKYHTLFRWAAIYPDQLQHLLNQQYDHLIFEDPPCHFFIHPKNIRLIANARRCTMIYQTDYYGILPSIYSPAIRLSNSLFFRSIHNKIKLISYSDNIFNSHTNINYSVLPAHGVREMFFSQNNLPRHNSVYFIGKIDKRHKRIKQILDWTKDICPVYIYGTGKDEAILSQYDHIQPMGATESPHQDLQDHAIYLSASECEGICTATAEALVMNKYALIKNATCNAIFRDTSNAVFFDSKADFQQKLRSLLKRPAQHESNREKFRWRAANQVLYRYITQT